MKNSHHSIAANENKQTTIYKNCLFLVICLVQNRKVIIPGSEVEGSEARNQGPTLIAGG